MSHDEPRTPQASPAAAVQPPAQATALELYQLHRAYIEHEDDLINNRVGSFIQLHSFLIATYGIIVTAIRTTYFPQSAPILPVIWVQGIACALLVGLSAIGLASSRDARESIGAADAAIDAVEAHWLATPEGSLEGSRLPGLTGGGVERIDALGARFHTRLPSKLTVLWRLSLTLPAAFLALSAAGQYRSLTSGQAGSAFQLPARAASAPGH